jgi:hypothetical protein
MNKRQLLLTVMLSLLTGSIGGVLGALVVTNRHGRAPQPTNAVRAQSFQVVAEDGTTRASMGFQSGEKPSIQLFSPTGKERMNITLDSVDEPIMTMSDIKDKPRVQIGHAPSDTASPEDDDWGAAIPYFEDSKAYIGTWKRSPAHRDGIVESGIVIVTDDSRHVHHFPALER